MTSFNITDPTSFLKLEIVEALRTVIDPELNVNLIDLGLIYEIEVDDQAKTITVTMTLSSSHCPMGDAIMNSVKNCLEHNFKNYTAEIVLTWTPQWNYERISEEGLKQLRGE